MDDEDKLTNQRLIIKLVSIADSRDTSEEMRSARMLLVLHRRDVERDKKVVDKAIGELRKWLVVRARNRNWVKGVRWGTNDTIEEIDSRWPNAKEVD